MKIGVVYPQTEYGHDPAAIKAYAQQAEALGYGHVLAYDHVLGANPARPGGWDGPYTCHDEFQEVFGLFSFMAAVTERIGFITGILILPQRQTALAAKQAATLDVLSGGRLRLGVGIGWNPVEFEALGENFRDRGKRVEEQVAVLRRLWAKPLVTFKGKWHTIQDAGLNPLPVQRPLPAQRPIPVWFGGHHDNVLRRVGTMGDGWLPGYAEAEAAKPSLEKIAAFAEQAGRDPAAIGLEPRLKYMSGDPDEWKRIINGWREVGATHLSLNTMGAGFDTPEKHLEAIERFAEEIAINE